LLDGDGSGRLAENVLRRGEARKKRILQDRFIIRLDRWADESGLFTMGCVEEIEDLVPPQLARRAALNYIARFSDPTEAQGKSFSVDLIEAKVAQAGGRIWNGLVDALATVFPDEHMEKTGFAREIIELIAKTDVEGTDVISERFSSLLGLLSDTLLDAMEYESLERSDDRVHRAVQTFLRDYPKGMRKSEAMRTLRTINAALAETAHADQIRKIVSQLGRDYELNDLSHPNVPRFNQFRDDVKALNNWDRVMYQDDSNKDPSQAFSASPTLEEPAEAGHPTTSSDDSLALSAANV
jgi:hypothetical protein